MSGVHHLSMRVPWRDRPWDQFVCDDPLGNSSCTLLANVGPRREDAFEVEHAGAAIDTLDQDRLPCLSERATFMSPVGYTVTKTHPYARNRALQNHLHPTDVTMPGYAFEAVPFRWLNRSLLTNEVGLGRIAGYDGAAEAAVDEVVGFDGVAWVMDGGNQRAVLSSFFESVVPQDSLVFVYLKHSPLQEQRTDRLLVGAARVSGVTAPPMWNQSGAPPFSSSMWETVVEHSLRPAMDDGILLPYQQLIPLLDNGIAVDGALAWAPEGRQVEFSYVTEHVSDDAAIESLASLERAAYGIRELGVEVPDRALDWVAEQTRRLWLARGPVPGLSAVLGYLGVAEPLAATRAVRGCTTSDPSGRDPWPLLDAVLDDPSVMPEALASHLVKPVRRIWSKLQAEHRSVLRLLSGFDLSVETVRLLMSDQTDVPLPPEDLLVNPYLANTCTHGMAERVPFATVDRALYPPSYVPWSPVVPAEVSLDGPLDRRRIEALLAEVIERKGAQGDTVVPVLEAIDAANETSLGQPATLTLQVLIGLGLDHEAVLDLPDWSPLYSIELGGDAHAFKLTRFEETTRAVREPLEQQRGHAALGALPDAREILDATFDGDEDVRAPTAGTDSELEERARQEKAEGLSSLYCSPLSVLIGPAGTGKTKLLKALVEVPGVADGGLLLLAPTGKAKVQLGSKIGREARTLASFLTPSGRYDGATGRYRVLGDTAPRQGFGLVVIDEASMLTEEMLAATLDALAGVRRLILVGDPRQLPPIGPGRPFVDLVAELCPESFDGWTRVAPGYVELQVPRRQLPDGSVDGPRHDLELAAWFGNGGLGAADDAIWGDLVEDPDRPTLRYEPWGDRSATAVLADVMSQELPLDAHPDPERAFALTYGGTENGQYLNWEPGAAQDVESWQILSPTRSRVYGTVELNRHVKRTYRTSDTEFAQKWRKYNIASPVGPEQIVRGDKVMQTVNKRMKAWPSREQGYVANGEIGVGIGRLTAAQKRPKRSLWLNVEFSSQPGAQYGYRPTSREDPPLELAWAVTVHKSQGSEFGTTFVVLPARANVSRELMYTALTRQRERVVILHEGTLADLRDLAAPWRSETARRLTDLFATPDPVSIKLRGQARRYDRKLLHVAANGVPMASKNEVIIAGLLDQLAPGRWEYERPLSGSDGREVLPDFTITTLSGQTVYWEHAGMLDHPDYARKWELKKVWYAENGIRPHSEGGGPNGVLMWTDDLEGANAQAWQAHAAEVLGVDQPTDGTTAGGASGRRTRTKLVPRR
ncbi:ATP-dependent RecD-like DNA helicase [Pseudonocardia sp. ICBG1034]|uniref:ATP-dependent DNA helicase n=1 Tax=Pseudonocardia sp. ICBG1034 TaxID=2844381 RepID=UPI001CCB810F|nr:ATP-dependent RecD-like DNA helicase [Pseudonocardia sp. ICBG1034]